MLPTVLALLAGLPTSAQDLEVHPNDPLHRFAELTVDEHGAFVEYTAEVDGWLSVWCTSDSSDPQLQVAGSARWKGLSAEGDTGSLSAWSGHRATWQGMFELAPGEVLLVEVNAPNERSGTAELHFVAVPEDPLHHWGGWILTGDPD